VPLTPASTATGKPAAGAGAGGDAPVEEVTAENLATFQARITALEARFDAALVRKAGVSTGLLPATDGTDKSLSKPVIVTTTDVEFLEVQTALSISPSANTC
jgi:hypothetical protein